MKTAVQIGVMDGTNGDFFHDLCIERGVDRVVLVEPQTRYNSAIRERYADISNHALYNYAITSKESIKTAEMYLLNDNGGHNSLSKRVSHPVRTDGDNLPSRRVLCTTFNNLCNMAGVREVDLLCIDTEGLDAEIIHSIDFDRVGIDTIIWEKWNHADDDENGVYQTGPEMDAGAQEYLKANGYEISMYDDSNWMAKKKVGKNEL